MFYRTSLFKIQFVVEPSKSSSTHCNTCTLKINTGVIRIVINRWMKSSLYYHLQCFDPKVKQYIFKDDIRINLANNDLELFEKWLEDWNKNYYCLDFKEIKYDIPKQSLKLIIVPYKRAYLEIFKYLNIREILTTIIHVNKQFYQTTWTEELWEYLLKRDFSIKCSGSNPKQAYATHFSLVCADCLKLTSKKSFVRCPYLKKNLCNECYRSPRYYLLKQTSIKATYGIDLDKLDIEPCTTDGHSKVVYSSVFASSLSRFRKAQKEKILQMMQVLGSDHPALSDVLNIDTDKMDIETPQSHPYKKIVKPNIPNVEWSFFEKVFHFIRSGKGKMTEKILKKKIETDFKF